MPARLAAARSPPGLNPFGTSSGCTIPISNLFQPIGHSEDAAKGKIKPNPTKDKVVKKGFQAQKGGPNIGSSSSNWRCTQQQA
ncbi:hypothetical protein PCANC_11841 [Puccinia coronata f. sp. avenae]|uniref:Uncharacterized protein n=1 Tax=Puccinia coronata f. sp. avenae TaxID=200324 RepID=A0A2N5T0D0_9BASI|nr:hypothetical protein PCANC_11841 [Puccinia coronata f. sp. avenae]